MFLERGIHHLIDILANDIGVWGYVFLFIITLAESLPIIGIVVPGGIIVLAAGFFIRIGVFAWAPTLVVVISGAIIADGFSYYLGHHYGESFLLRWGKYFFFKPHHFDKSKSLLHGHPGKAIIGGRFYAVTRAIVPFLAGSSKISVRTFVQYSTLGAVIWACINVGAGYVFGEGFQIAGKYLGYIFIAATVVAIVVLYLYRFVTSFTARNKEFIDRYQVYPLFVNLLSISIFAKLLESITRGSRLISLDHAFAHSLHVIQTPILTNIFIFITNVANPINVILIALCMTVYFARKHRWYYELLLPLALTGGVLSGVYIKYLTDHLRPSFSLISIGEYSFPSGHATVATIFFTLMIYFFARKIKNNLSKTLFISANIAAWFLVCFSRLYLNVHWLSDVLAGIALGVFWVTVSMIALEILKVFQYGRKGERGTESRDTSEKS